MSNFDYYNFQIKNAKGSINKEIEFYQGCDWARAPAISQYLLYLKGRLGMDKQEPLSITRYDSSGARHVIERLNPDEYAKDMDILVFKRPWSTLKNFHKIMKIKEFVHNLKYGPKVKPTDVEKNKSMLKEEICKGLSKKKFGKNKSEVIYDSKLMAITSISCLSFVKKTGIYEVDWDE